MLTYILGSDYHYLAVWGCVLFGFIITCAAISLLKDKLPRDGGRKFAINGAKSIGKPRGAGIIFVLTWALTAVVFLKLSIEIIIYIVLVIAAMLTGYLDDASEKPWGELKKGILDFIIAVVAAVTYLFYNPNTIYLAFIGKTVSIPYVLYGILIVILIWASINVTNCSDGVDGLCATLSIITLVTTYLLFNRFNANSEFKPYIIIMIVCLLAYLWFNASPSQLLMGDAGSRAIGLFIAFAFLKLQSPLLYLIAAIMLIIDGGLGLIKVTIMRVFKVKFMSKLRTPIHDHMRKNKEWSDTQVVIRFGIIQTIIACALLFFFAK